MAARVVCISVIDENQNSASQTYFNNSWSSFRNTYPNRIFYLLDPGGGSFGYVPPAYTADPEAFGPITVNRDGNNVANRSDWFDICGLNQAEDGTVVSLAVDTSGSMVLNTVRASYDYFIAQCNAAGFSLVIDTTFSGERWIDPHNKAVPPNTAISVSPTTILRNGSGATLTWTSAGDITLLSVTNQTNPDLSDSVTVNPQNTTTYEINASGPEGDSSDTVTLTVVGPPNISSFTASPNPQTSGLDGIPNYNTTLSWSASTDLTITSATISSGSYSASVPNPSASGSFEVTNLPQSVAGSGGASRTYTLTLCHELACATETVTVEVTNDRTPSNTWTTSFTGLDPSTQYTRNLGTLAGIDMTIKVESSSNGVFFSNSSTGSFSNPNYFTNGESVYVRTTSLPFNPDTSGLSSTATVGKTNTKTFSVSVGGLSAFDVSYVTRGPVIGETFNFDGASGEYPYEDIDLITNTPSEFAVTQTLNMDDIDVDVEIRTDDPNVQIKINNSSWQNIQEI